MNAVLRKIDSEWNKARLWRGFAAFEAIFFACVVSFVVYLHTLEKFVVVVQNGKHFMGSAKPITLSKEERILVAKYASVALFNRTFTATRDEMPMGFTYWEMAHLAFSSEAMIQILAEAQKDMAIFQAQQITQSFQPTGKVVEESSDAEGSADMRVDGVITQNKLIEGVAKSESHPVITWMHLQVNDHMETNDKLPLVVISLKVKVLP